MFLCRLSRRNQVAHKEYCSQYNSAVGVQCDRRILEGLSHSEFATLEKHEPLTTEDLVRAHHTPDPALQPSDDDNYAAQRFFFATLSNISRSKHNFII